MKYLKTFLAETQYSSKNIPRTAEINKDTPAKKALRKDAGKSKSAMTDTGPQPQFFDEPTARKFTKDLASRASSVTGTTYDADPDDLKTQTDDDVLRQTIARVSGAAAKQRKLQNQGPDSDDVRKRKSDIVDTLNTGIDNTDLDPDDQNNKKNLSRTASQVKADGTNKKIGSSLKNVFPDKAGLSPEQEMMAGGIDADKVLSDEEREQNKIDTRAKLLDILGLDSEAAIGQEEIAKAMANSDVSPSEFLDNLDSIAKRRQNLVKRMDHAGGESIMQGVDSKAPGVERDFDDAMSKSMLAGHEENIRIGGDEPWAVDASYKPETASAYGFSGVGAFPTDKDGRHKADSESITRLASAMQDPDDQTYMDSDGVSRADARNRKDSDRYPQTNDLSFEDFKNYGFIDQDNTDGGTEYMGNLINNLNDRNYEQIVKDGHKVDLPEDPEERQKLIEEFKGKLGSKSWSGLLSRGMATGSKQRVGKDGKSLGYGALYGGDLGEAGAKWSLNNPDSPYYDPDAPPGMYAFANSGKHAMPAKLLTDLKNNRAYGILEKIMRQGGADGYNPMIGLESFGNMDLEHVRSAGDVGDDGKQGWDHPDNWLMASRIINQGRGDTPLLEWMQTRYDKAVEGSAFGLKSIKDTKDKDGNITEYGMTEGDQFSQRLTNYMDKQYENDPELKKKLDELGIDPSKINITRGALGRPKAGPNQGADHPKRSKDDVQINLSKMSREEIIEQRKKAIDAGIPKHIAKRLFEFPNPKMGDEEYLNDRLSKRKNVTQSDIMKYDFERNPERKASFMKSAEDRGIPPERAEEFWNSELERFKNRVLYNLEDPSTERNRSYLNLDDISERPKPSEAFDSDDDEFDLDALSAEMSGATNIGDLSKAAPPEPEPNPKAKPKAKPKTTSKKVSTKPSDAQVDKAIADVRGEKPKMDDSQAQALKDYIEKHKKNPKMRDQITKFKKQLIDNGFEEEEENKEDKPKASVRNNGRGKTYKKF